MLTRKTVTRSLIAAAVILIVSFYAYHVVYSLLLDAVKMDGVRFIQTSTGRLGAAILFCLSFALVPVASLLIWKYGRVHSTSRRIFTILVIVACELAALAMRIMMLQYALSYNVAPNVLSMPDTSSLLFERYLFYGFLAGTIIAYFTFRSKTEPGNGIETG